MDSASDIGSALRAYLADPYSLWGEKHRSAKKLDNRVGKIRTDTSLSHDETIEHIIAAGCLRRRYAAPTVYIASIGSSGSHWLQAMIARLKPALPGGEVYLPAPFLSMLPSAPRAEAQLMLQAIYVAHAFDDSAALVSASAINTAHVPEIRRYSDHDIDSIRILLVRDPVETIISRTFRKPEYRAYLNATTVSDTEYLEVNIRRVLGFYKRVNKADFHYICTYERLRHEPWGVLADIAELLHVRRAPKELEEIANSMTEDAVRENAQAASKTNIFKGERKPIANEFMERAREAAAPVMEAYGYALEQGRS